MNLLSEKYQAKIDNYAGAIEKFISLEGTYDGLKIYTLLVENNKKSLEVLKSDIPNSEFINTLQNMRKYTELSDDEKSECRKDIDGVLGRIKI